MPPSEFDAYGLDVNEETPIAMRRTTSNILAEFPWCSRQIVMDATSLREVPLDKYQLFGESLHAYETQLLKFDGNDDHSAMLCVLGITVNKTPNSSVNQIISKHNDSLSISQYQRMASLLSAYRFFEILGLRAGILKRIPNTLPRISMYLPPVDKYTENIRYYGHLSCWPTLVSKFRTLADETTPSLTPTRHFNIPMMSILRMLERTATNTQFLNISENFLFAALEIAALRHIAFKPGVLPDLPLSCPSLSLQSAGTPEYEEFMKAYNKFMEAKKGEYHVAAAPIAFRNSFHLAVLISPLFLLAPCSLFKKSFNRRAIISAASRLGPHKPHTLRIVEDLIWNALFKLASGNIHVDDVLRELSRNIPPSILDDARNSSTDSTWFKLPNDIPYLRFEPHRALIEHSVLSNSANMASSQDLAPIAPISLNHLLSMKWAWSFAPHYNIPFFPISTQIAVFCGPLRLGDTTQHMASMGVDISDVNAAAHISDPSTLSQDSSTHATVFSLPNEQDTLDTTMDLDPDRASSCPDEASEFIRKFLMEMDGIINSNNFSSMNTDVDGIDNNAMMPPHTYPQYENAMSVNFNDDIALDDSGVCGQLSRDEHLPMFVNPLDLVLQKDNPNFCGPNLLDPSGSSNIVNAGSDIRNEINPDSDINEGYIQSHTDNTDTTSSHNPFNMIPDMLLPVDYGVFGNDITYVQQNFQVSHTQNNPNNVPESDKEPSQLMNITSHKSTSEADTPESSHSLENCDAERVEISSPNKGPPSSIKNASQPSPRSHTEPTNPNDTDDNISDFFDDEELKRELEKEMGLLSDKYRDGGDSEENDKNITGTKIFDDSGDESKVCECDSDEIDDNESDGVNIDNNSGDNEESDSNKGEDDEVEGGKDDNDRSNNGNINEAELEGKKGGKDEICGNERDEDDSDGEKSGSDQYIGARTDEVESDGNENIRIQSGSNHGDGDESDGNISDGEESEGDQSGNCNDNADNDDGSTSEKDADKEDEGDTEKTDGEDSDTSMKSNGISLKRGANENAFKRKSAPDRALASIEANNSATATQRVGVPLSSNNKLSKRQARKYLTYLFLLKSASVVGSDDDTNSKSLDQALPYRILKRAASAISFDTLGTASNPIDVDNLGSIFESPGHGFVPKEEISLATSPVSHITSDTEFKAFDAQGNVHTFSACFHHQVQDERFTQFMTAVEQSYIQGKPRHVLDMTVTPQIAVTDMSVIKCLSYEEWTKSTAAFKQDLLSRKNVIISGWPVEQLSFDEEGMRQVAGMPFRQISIQDYSMQTTPTSCAGVTVSGLVGDLLKNVGPSGKILNALDLPRYDAAVRTAEYTTDIHAFDFTRGVHGTSMREPYLTGDMRWSTVGLQHSMTYNHVDSDGLSTIVDILCGKKLWGFLCPKETASLRDIGFFMNPEFYLHPWTHKAPYIFEAIVLKPGDRLFMMAGQPHFVYGIENTMCHGEHYYSTDQMQQTFCSLIHSFMLNEFITNTSHPTRVLLRRIVLFFHMAFVEDLIPKTDPAWSQMPHIMESRGLFNLMSALVVVILGNVLDPRTYQPPSSTITPSPANNGTQTLLEHDINMISLLERMAIVYARGVALHLMNWIRKFAVVKDKEGTIIQDFPTMFLERTVQCLEQYRTQVAKNDFDDGCSCDRKSFAKQIQNIRSIYADSWILPPKEQHISLLLDDQLYTVTWSDQRSGWGVGYTSYMSDGMTLLDKKFFCAQAHRRRLEKDIVLYHLQDQEPVSEPPLKRRRK